MIAAVVLAAALLPFAVMGDDLAGGELLSVAAMVTLGGLVSSTLLNLFVLPAVCLRLAPIAPAPDVSESLDELDWETRPMEVAV
jgi:Cu/Ag efflux pump CusA